MMNLNVLRNGQSIYMREQPFGGNTLTQEIQRAFGMSAEEAEAAKRAGGLPDNYESEVLAPFMDTMGLEVARALIEALAEGIGDPALRANFRGRALMQLPQRPELTARANVTARKPVPSSGLPMLEA